MQQNPHKLQKAVFLDRDGVINQLIMRKGKAQAPYIIEELALFPGVEEACHSLKAASYLLIVVTNQPDVARGWVNLESVEIINKRIRELLPIDDVEICFHTDIDQCHCRKPMPGMLIEASKRWNIDLSKSYMVGDRYGDIGAGVKAGCTTILVGPGDKQGHHPDPHFKATSLLESSRIILGDR